MSHGTDSPMRSAQIAESFASGVLAHVEEFLRSQGTPQDVFIRIVLVNNAELYLRGLRVDHLKNVPGCVMLRGTDQMAIEAIVIRKEHLFVVDFSLSPFTRSSSFGFATAPTP